MSSDKRTARIIGVLFIIATAASIASSPFLTSISSSNYLVDISANGNWVLVGALLAFIAAVASASIAIALYPTLKRYNETLALGAVGFRLIEGVLYIVGIVGLLSLLTVSQQSQLFRILSLYPSYFQTLGESLLAGYHWVYYGAAVLAFCIGALMYYITFYQTKLVPRWLSGWGLGGVTLLAAGAILVMFGVVAPLSTPHVIFALPIAVQEMALAVWLIIRGFNPSAIAHD
jgi:uncharacterized protein DUF4386